MIQPFNFAGGTKSAADELARFDRLAAASKPPGYNDAVRRRILCYLHQHRQLVVEELKRRYPETWAEISVYTLPVTKHFVRELSMVFLEGASYEISGADGEPLPDDAEELQAWESLVEDVALDLKLKNVDRYTTLLNTSFLLWGHSERGVVARIVMPNAIDVVWDPAHPFDLDMAHGIRIEVGSEDLGGNILGADGKLLSASKKRFVFWCARKGEEQYRTLWSTGEVEANETDAFPYVDDEGKPVVPLVMFTGHTEELSAFTLAGQGLADFDVALCVSLSNLQHIAESNGFGQLVITTAAGSQPPSKLVRGPTRAIPLPEGNTAQMLSGDAPIRDLVEKVQADLKLAALTHGIPPGAVSLEARAVASGVALQVEMRPLLEAREDSVEVYAGPMRRLWKVARAVHTVYAKQVGEPQLPADLEARWSPGAVQAPVDPAAELDQDLVELANDLVTAAEIIARRRRMPLDEARKLYEEIRTENASRKGAAAAAPGVPGAPGVAGGARAQLQPPGALRRAAKAGEELGADEAPADGKEGAAPAKG